MSMDVFITKDGKRLRRGFAAGTPPLPAARESGAASGAAAVGAAGSRDAGRSRLTASRNPVTVFTVREGGEDE